MELAKIRDLANMTQQTLAEKTGVTRQMISAVENGIRPSVSTAKKIAAALNFEAFGCDWTKFFEDDKPEKKQPPWQRLKKRIAPKSHHRKELDIKRQTPIPLYVVKQLIETDSLEAANTFFLQSGNWILVNTYKKHRGRLYYVVGRTVDF